MEDVLVQKALAQATLSAGGEALHEALLAEVWERHKDELSAQIRAALVAERQAEDEAREESWAARRTAERRAMRQEVEAEYKATHDRELEGQRRDFEARIDRLIARRAEETRRREAVEAWVLDFLTTALLPDGEQTRLRTAEVKRFKLHTVNALLAPLGYQVSSRAIPGVEDGLGVATELGPAHWAEQHRFWVIRVPPTAGVSEPEGDEPTPAPEVKEG